MVDLDNFICQSHENLFKNKECLKYLLSRGVDQDQINKYQFGYVEKKQLLPNHDNFKEWSRNGNLFFNRFIFPLKDTQGKIKAIGCRPYKGNGSYLYYYFNRAEATYFGISNLEEVFKNEICYLTEGIFDHIVLERVFKNSLCALTANISQKQIRFLKRYTKTLVFLFDVDKIGNGRVNRVITENPDLLIYRIGKFLQKSQKAKDLNQLYQILGEEKFQEFIVEQNNLFIF